MSKISIEGNASGTGTFTIASPNSNTNRTLDLPDNTGTIITSGSTGGVSQAMLATGVGGTGPAFSAYKSASGQTITAATATKITFDVELFDTNSNFASSRFTPTVTGYYQVNGLVFVSGNLIDTTVWVYKNGSAYKRGFGFAGSSTQEQMSVSCLVYLNGSTDYIEIYAYADTTSGNPLVDNNATNTWFDACLIRAA